MLQKQTNKKKNIQQLKNFFIISIKCIFQVTGFSLWLFCFSFIQRLHHACYNSVYKTVSRWEKSKNDVHVSMEEGSGTSASGLVYGSGKTSGWYCEPHTPSGVIYPGFSLPARQLYCVKCECTVCMFSAVCKTASIGIGLASFPLPYVAPCETSASFLFHCIELPFY